MQDSEILEKRNESTPFSAHSETESRIDRIYVRTKEGIGDSPLTVSKPPTAIKTLHSILCSELVFSIAPPIKHKRLKLDLPRVSNLNEQACIRIAKNFANLIAPHVHHWIETLSKAPENLDAANEVIFQFTQMLVGTALHATNLGDKKTVSNQERKTRNSCKHLRSALFFIRKAETDKSSSFEFGIWHKLNPKLPDLARFHPTVLPVMSLKWEDWKQTVIKERNNKRLVWLSQIRSFTPRSAKWTVDPQAAIKSVLRGSEDNEISSIICGETNTFTTEPNQIAHVVREHFKSKIGISGLPEPHPVPRWVTDEELRQSHLDGQYNDLISPLTQNEILDQLKKTEKTTAPGPDRLAPLLLKIAIVNAPPDDDSALTLTTAIANAVFVTRGALDVCKHSIGKA